MPNSTNKVIVAITGASGSVYSRGLLEKLTALDPPGAEIAVILTDTARQIWEYETGGKFECPGNIKEFKNDDFFAPVASGSSDYNIMIICPASMGMIGRIANGISDDLITRAADVMLKERRKLILVPRETPYNLIHIRNMESLTLAGAIVCPATPSFYSRPHTLQDLVMTVVDRIISLAGFDAGSFRWMEND